MQKINNIKLPKKYPTNKAIKSWGQNIHDYEPVFWEFQYEIYRYLQNVNDNELTKRYNDISRNFKVFCTKERNVIPINSFQSSWYWFRKEHQTRYEFLFRKLPLPEPPRPRKNIKKPYSSKKPMSGDILFRYGYHDPIKDFFKFGRTKIKPASGYKDGVAFDPRTDDEKNKDRWFTDEHTKITMLGGKELPIKGDVKSTVSACDYYALCLSCEFEPLMFKKFGYDTCLIISDPNTFFDKIEKEIKKQIPDWYFHHNPIHYYDPYEAIKNEYFSPTMCKDFSYAYQMEYRIILDPMQQATEAFKISEFEIEIGSLKNICEIYYK